MNKNQPILAEELWDHLLCRQAEQILSVYQELSKTEQIAIRNHLKQMTLEEGWHDEQRISAQVALTTISETKGK